MNPNLQKGLRIAVIAGSAVITVSAVYALFSKKLGTQSIMPAVTALVGISAFSYAISNDIKVVPQI